MKIIEVVNNKPGDGLEICSFSNPGFKRNSNHKTVSGEIGTVPGLNKSTSIVIPNSIN